MDTKQAFLARTIIQRAAILANIVALIGVAWFWHKERWLNQDELVVSWLFFGLAALNLLVQIAPGAPLLLVTMIKRRRLEEEAKVRHLETAK